MHDFRDFIRFSRYGMDGVTNPDFMPIPKMKLEEGIECSFISDGDADCECKLCKIRDGIEMWKETVVESDAFSDRVPIDLKVPFVWEVLNTRLFHWLCKNPQDAKEWINACLPDEL